MESGQPLSPPQSNDGDFQNMHLIAQHNAAIDSRRTPKSSEGVLAGDMQDVRIQRLSMVAEANWRRITMATLHITKQHHHISRRTQYVHSKSPRNPYLPPYVDSHPELLPWYTACKRWVRRSHPNTKWPISSFSTQSQQHRGKPKIKISQT